MPAAQRVRTEDLLANLPLFREASPEEIARIAAGSREIRATRGEVLFQKGDPCDGIHIVVYGQVKLAFASPAGAEKVVEIIGRGQSFGEAFMFMERPYGVYAQALADSLLIFVSRAAIFSELDRDPGFARRMIAGLSRRLHALLADLEAYSLHSGAQRIVGYLLNAGPEGDEAAGATLRLPVGKSVLASRLNLTPEHFSRILHELAAAGLIEVDGRNVTIRDIDRLRSYPG